MSSDVIREFLVKLGYKVDSTGQRKFVDGVDNATKVVNGLGKAVKIFAAGGAVYGVVSWMKKMTTSLDGLYFSAQRSGTSAKNLQAFSYAASQMGSSVQEAQSAVQGFHQWMLNNPGSEMWLRSLGISTRDRNGRMRDSTSLLQDFGKKLGTMPTYLQNQYAKVMGIPLNLRLALQKGMGGYIDDYRKMLDEAGLDSDKAAKRSHKFATEVRGLGGAFQVLGLKIADSLMGGGGGGDAITRFRHLLLSHSKQITRIIRKIADAFQGLFVKVLNWLDGLDWNKIDEGMKNFIKWFKSINWSEIGKEVKEIAEGLGKIASFLGSIGSNKTAKSVNNTVESIRKSVGGMKSGLAHWAAKKANDRSFSDKGSLANRFMLWLAKKNGLKPAEPKNTQYEGHWNPIGIRNNNPGNLRTGPNGSFGSYGDAQSGLNALAKQLMLYYTGKSKAAGGHRLTTLRDIISTYAPSSENNTSAYIADLAKRMGVSPDQQLNLRNQDQLQALMRGIVRHENGMNPYSAEMFRAASGSVASPRGRGSMQATTTINVYGNNNPHATAQAVAGEQNTVNQRLFRDFAVPVQ